ncbi:DUF4291 domain-containing protein [Polaribacter glomeratus]|uniref:DUF4291 domain-containing protein n=1 Tax=Polaribacter glomeratus TaxID=102 RepID=A0A2S7WUF6_9FLAO|nr:DUF4291 domain-containing protein [Polaribacter glomeratus]PQJ81219.1 hypothetical protein BTO16_00835 [Polaribacter glomeratus]TXD65776.1 DUF4291 domain-containing protein [Polaribacter glomeratus]
MKIKTKLYKEQIKEWPEKGHHIMAQFDDEKIVVYQSYRPEIGNFAFQNQYFGGAFSLNRMTWIKPNFLWMMYRNGWGTKFGQEIVLAIHLKRDAFERYLNQAVYSNFQNDIYGSKETWQAAVKNSNIRLQWDPDHNPYGDKLERRAIQIGIRNQEIVKYAKEDILEIEDISAFVKEQHQFILNNELDKLMIPEEKPFIPNNREILKLLKLNDD